MRQRFAGTAEAVAEETARRQADLTARVRRFVDPGGGERALDAGCGAGALALALAPHVREVVGVDVVPELLE
ncbi:MAG TPA: methyltransferase domain-containing protein, partial [Gaiellaceae bacterium]